MALQYHLVLRKNLSKDVEAGKEKLYYAQTRATGTYVPSKSYAPWWHRVPRRRVAM